MQQQDIIQKIQDLIAEGETEEAVNAMVAFAKANNPDIHEDVILLSGQYKQWKRENMLGIEQSDSELHRIQMGLLELLRNGQLPADRDGGRLPRAAASRSGGSALQKKLPLIGGVLGIVAVVIVLWMAIGGKDADVPAADTPEQPVVSEPSSNIHFTRLQINPGTVLVKDQRYPTADNRFYLVFQEDGNLCVQNSTDDLFKWGSYQESEILAAEARFTEDGNLVIQDAGNRSWSTQTADPGARLAISNHGRLLIVNAANKVIWEGEEAE